MRARILFKEENVPVHLFADVRVQIANVPLRGGSDFNSVGQVSVPQFSHEVPERNGSLILRLYQSGPGVFDVNPVHFLLGKAIEEKEVFYGNDGGQIFPKAGDNRPLIAKCSAVHYVGKFFPCFGDV